MGEIISHAANLGFSPYETFMDSTGLTRHGRDMVHQESMAREQMAWQSNENQLNRDFSQKMYEQQVADYMKNYPELMQKQSDIQFNLWKNQQQYNSPAEMAARSLVGGFNPAANSAQLVQGSSANPSISLPPQIHGSPLGGSASPVGIPQGMSSELMSQFGQFMRDVSQAGVSRKTIEKLDADIQKELSEKDLVDSQRSYQEMKNGLYQVFGYRKETYELLRLYQESYRLKAAGDLDGATEKLQEANKRLVNSEAKKNEDLLPTLIEINQNQIEVLKSEKKKNLAQAFEASQAANYYKENSETLKQLRPYSVKFEEYKAKAQKYVSDSAFWQSLIERDNSVVSSATKEERISYAIKSAEQQGLINDKLGYEIQEAMAKGEFAEAKELMGLIESGVSIGTDIGRAQSLDRFATNQAIRNQIDQNYYSWKMSHTETTKTYNGKGKLKSEQHRIYR